MKVTAFFVIFTVVTNAAFGQQRAIPTSEEISSPAYQQGFADRQAWESWFAALTGDYRAGAEYWSTQRSIPKPGPCFGPAKQAIGDWTAGCLAAQQRLSPSDVRRKAESNYRLGWNGFSPTAPALTPQAGPLTDLGNKSTDASAPLRISPRASSVNRRDGRFNII